jgi:hypothetical protein
MLCSIHLDLVIARGATARTFRGSGGEVRPAATDICWKRAQPGAASGSYGFMLRLLVLSRMMCLHLLSSG